MSVSCCSRLTTCRVDPRRALPAELAQRSERVTAPSRNHQKLLQNLLKDLCEPTWTKTGFDAT